MDSHLGSSSLLKQAFGHALITIGIIIVRVIKRGKKSRNQYRIPFAAVVKTREMGLGGRKEGGRRGEGRRGWREGGAGVGW